MTVPNHAAPAAAEPRSAEHDGGEDLQEHRRADQRIDASALGADENPRRPIEEPPPGCR